MDSQLSLNCERKYRAFYDLRAIFCETKQGNKEKSEWSFLFHSVLHSSRVTHGATSPAVPSMLEYSMMD